MLASRLASAQFAGEESDLIGTLDSLRELVAEAPSEVEPKLLLLSGLAGEDATRESLRLMQDILVLDPLNSMVLMKIARAYMAMEDWDKARSVLNRSLEIDPDQPGPYQSLAHLDQAVGDGVGFVNNYLMAMKVDAQDHGYPARLANFLYGLGLQSEGDRFRARTVVIAPTSSHARRTELEQAVLSGDGDVSYALAQQMLEDGVDLQSGAWRVAAFELFAIAENQGQTEDALDFAERQFPGFGDFGQPAPLAIIYARIAALSAYYGVESHEEFQLRLTQLDQHLDGAGPGMRGPWMRMRVLALRGDAQAAIDVALSEIFSKPAIRYVDIDRTFDLQFMAEVAADPRIQQALARWQDEKEDTAEEVRDYLAGVEAI